MGAGNGGLGELLLDRAMGVQVYILRGRYTASTCLVVVCARDGDGKGDGDGNVDDNDAYDAAAFDASVIRGLPMEAEDGPGEDGMF
jgi:hypothetical protein